VPLCINLEIHFTVTEDLKKILWATALRATLLPRLVSGQSRLPPAEAALADAVVALRQRATR
jgi:hypothetical protein